MILNEAKVIYISPCCVGGGILNENLSNKDKEDARNSFQTTSNQYVKVDDALKDYCSSKNSLYPPHISRLFFDRWFLGNRADFFYLTMVRNPWCHSLSLAKHIIRIRQLDIPINLDNKQNINDLVNDIYNNTKNYPEIVSCYYYNNLINSDTNVLDYDFILYFEEIDEDLKTLSHLTPLKFHDKLNIKYKKIDYREYLTQDNIDLISEKRKIDIEIFGYDFEKGMIFKNNQPKIKDMSLDFYPRKEFKQPKLPEMRLRPVIRYKNPMHSRVMLASNK